MPWQSTSSAVPSSNNAVCGRPVNNSWLLGLPLVLSACSTTGPLNHPSAAGQGSDEQDGPPGHHVDVASIADPVPRVEPRSRYGNPAFYEVEGKRYFVQASGEGHVERGMASWYGTKFHGKRTSSGEPYDLAAMTGAHRTLPLPSYVEVTNLENGRKVIVRVNDRGPFRRDRIIDVSYAAATKLGMLGKGTARVEIRVVATPRTAEARSAALSTPDTNAVGETYLQVGSFSERDNAERLLARLVAGAITPAHIRSTAEDDRTIYRVRIGPLSGQAEIDAAAQRLNELGIENSLVVVD